MTAFFAGLALFFVGLWCFTDRRWKETLDLCERAVKGWEAAEREITRLTRCLPGDEWKN